jgi:5-methylcytosine-specific restriction endonuclease McrA
MAGVIRRLVRWVRRQEFRLAAVAAGYAGWRCGGVWLAGVGAFTVPLLWACWTPGLLVPRRVRRWWRSRPYTDPETGEPARRPRPPIRPRVERAALALGRCDYCHARGPGLVFGRDRPPLAADHLCPYSEGGSNGLFNLGPLCRTCNGRKLDYWPGRLISRARKWRPARGAGLILAAERWARWSPLRWVCAWVALVA